MIAIIYSAVLNDRGHAINPHIDIKQHTRLSRHKTEEYQNLGSSNKLHTRDHACQVCDYNRFQTTSCDHNMHC